MKVIDLINKIANDEEMPRTIIYEGSTYEYRRDLDDYEYYNEFADHYDYLLENPYGKAYSEFYNDEVEIIEKDIEKIKDVNTDYYSKGDGYECLISTEGLVLDIQTLKHKVNEIIDYINEVEQ